MRVHALFRVGKSSRLISAMQSELRWFRKAYFGGGRAPKSPHLYRTLLVSTAALAAVTSARAESGLASYYGGIGHSGEMTCAHRTRPMGSMITVSYQGRSIRCRVNDRGPFVKGRVIDVSVGAARALGMTEAGVVRVSLESE
jgi:rare lipoprotein A